jgi:hypothetical protein
MHIQIFFDTCILIAYLNPAELLHRDAVEVFEIIENPSRFSIKGRIRDFRGYILDIVEQEFFDILHYKFNLVLQDIFDFVRHSRNFTGSQLTQRLDLLRRRKLSLANLIKFVLEHYDLSNISNLRDFIELFNQLRMIFRKKYFQLKGLKKIQFKRCAPHIISILDGMARNIRARHLDLTDKKILIYADHLALTHNPAYLLTIDLAMANQRVIILPQLPNNLSIMPLYEFGYIFLGRTEHIALVSDSSSTP